jgi:hypothetical protein
VRSSARGIRRVAGKAHREALREAGTIRPQPNNTKAVKNFDQTLKIKRRAPALVRFDAIECLSAPLLAGRFPPRL